MYFANRPLRSAWPSRASAVSSRRLKTTSCRETDPGNELGIIPVSVDAMRVVSPTVLALGINLMDYHGGNPDQLHDFARNCSLAVGVSEVRDAQGVFIRMDQLPVCQALWQQRQNVSRQG